MATALTFAADAALALGGKVVAGPAAAPALDALGPVQAHDALARLGATVQLRRGHGQAVPLVRAHDEVGLAVADLLRPVREALGAFDVAAVVVRVAVVLQACVGKGTVLSLRWLVAICCFFFFFFWWN